MKVIRKYGNRRLYDTSARRYVNLEEIAQSIRNGDEIQVVDAKSGEDLTRTILSQIIVEDAKTHGRGLPLEILKELISISDKAKNDLFHWYLQAALDTYRKAQSLFSLRPPDAHNEIEQLKSRISELERELRGHGQ